MSTYPEVYLELALGEELIDIVAKGFDAGIAPREPRGRGHDCRPRDGANENGRRWRAELILRNGVRRARPRISSVTAAFNIGSWRTAKY